MINTKEYRRIARQCAQAHGVQIGSSWTDEPTGRGWTLPSEPERTVTMEISGTQRQSEKFIEELSIYTKLLAGTQPRLSPSGYLKISATVK
jgi:hypothetical protein